MVHKTIKNASTTGRRTVGRVPERGMVRTTKKIRGPKQYGGMQIPANVTALVANRLPVSDKIKLFRLAHSEVNVRPPQRALAKNMLKHKQLKTRHGAILRAISTADPLDMVRAFTDEQTIKYSEHIPNGVGRLWRNPKRIFSSWKRRQITGGDSRILEFFDDKKVYEEDKKVLFYMLEQFRDGQIRDNINIFLELVTDCHMPECRRKRKDHEEYEMYSRIANRQWGPRTYHRTYYR